MPNIRATKHSILDLPLKDQEEIRSAWRNCSFRVCFLRDWSCKGRNCLPRICFQRTFSKNFMASCFDGYLIGWMACIDGALELYNWLLMTIRDLSWNKVPGIVIMYNCQMTSITHHIRPMANQVLISRRIEKMSRSGQIGKTRFQFEHQTLSITNLGQ